MEVKERYEVISPNLNGYAYIHDFITDNVLNTYDSCDLLNQQSKQLKELEAENKNLNKQLTLTEKAYKIAIFELDFARHHSQSTSQETVDRIEKLESEIWNKAKDKMQFR